MATAAAGAAAISSWPQQQPPGSNVEEKQGEGVGLAGLLLLGCSCSFSGGSQTRRTRRRARGREARRGRPVTAVGAGELPAKAAADYKFTSRQQQKRGDEIGQLILFSDKVQT